MKQSYALIAIVIIGALLVAPPIFNLLWEAIEKGLDKFERPVPDESETSEADGHSSIGLTIYYKDGSKQDFKTDSFSIIPLIVSDTKGEVEGIEVQVITTIKHNVKDMTQYDYIVTDFDAYITDASGNQIGALIENHKKTDTYNAQWKSGESKASWMAHWSAYQIGRVLEQQPQGTYKLKMHAEVRIRLHTKHDIIRKEGSGAVSWEFAFEPEQITSLSVTISTFKFR